MTSLLCRRHLYLYRKWNFRHLSRICNQPLTCSKKIPALSNSTLSYSRSRPKLQIDLVKSSIVSWMNQRYCHGLSKTHLDGVKSAASLSLNLCKSFSTTQRHDESSQPNLDPIKSTISSTLNQHEFSEKEENASNDIDQNSKIKLNEGDAALIVRGSEADDSGGCRVERYSLDDVQQKYNAVAHIVKNSGARGYLNNFGQGYKSAVGKDIDLKYHFSRYSLQGDAPGKKNKKKDSHWACVLKLKTPFPIEMRAVGSTKSVAADLVARLMIHELYIRKLINIKGKVVSGEKTMPASARSVQTPVGSIGDLLSVCSLQDLTNVTEQYEQVIVPLIESFEQEELQCKQAEKLAKEARALESDDSSDSAHLRETLPRRVDSRAEQQRNLHLERKAKVLMERASSRLAAGQRKKLPIEDYRRDIVDTVANNTITIIKGEPGCGKSTQVAQMILNEASLRGQGTWCNILITQPRRISAISLAKRVASEREESVGESIGYQVRLQRVFPRDAGHIQFITTGILLSRLQTQQGLDQVSHIILDEAHERDVSTDLLLLLTKRLLQERPGLKLLVMSATLNAEMFQRYFESAPVLSIPGFTHPVQRNYLSLDTARQWQLCRTDAERMSLVSSREPTTNAQIICNLILWIHRNKPEGAILCFLPGWQDIQQVCRLLESLPEATRLHVTLAHSKLDTDVQGAIFAHPPPGIRKVVLSTNVAETSVTIDDVAYVVDTGCHKETRYDAKDDLVSLDNHWISRASVNQRAGRAGRTKPGESFHLYSEERYKKMAEYSLPEIFRKPLEEVLLTCKLYGDESSEELLSQLPEPPDAASIQAAVTELKHMGVFDADESLTPLGKRIAAMQCHPKLSTALVQAVIFKCALPMGNIVTLLSTPERPLFENAILSTSKDAIRDIKANLSRYSDHIAGSRLLNDWGSNSPRRGNVHEYLHERNLRNLYDIRDQLMNALYANRLLDEDTDWAALSSGRGLLQGSQNVNKMAHIDEWVRSILYAGVQNLLVARTARGKQRLCTEQGQVCSIVKESVNSGLKSAASPLLTYYDAVTSLQRRITLVRDSSVLSPISVLLFRRGSATLLSAKEAARIKSDLNEEECIVSLTNEVKACNIVVANESQALLLLRLRDILSRVSLFFIAHQGHPLSRGNVETYQKIDRYRDQLLDSVMPLFTHYTRQIDDHRRDQQRN